MSESISLSVSGMKCGGCENTITTKLTALAGVVSVKASFQDNQVEVEYLPEQIGLNEIEDAIVDAGFNVD
ncbi:MAG: heavy-metal-associated domain-containing protein [Methylomonas sp.]